STRTWPALLGLAGALMLAAAHTGPASAAHVARLDIRPGTVAAGGEITVFGPPGWAPAPVSIRWNSLDGQVLGTFPTTPGGNASFGPGTVKVPDVPPGVYELVGTQEPPESSTALRGVPARARVVVTGPGGAQPAPAAETQPLRGLKTLKESGGPSTANLVLVGVAIFALTVGAALVPTLATRRRAA
ncbi:MAG TPA: hypothetical protein VFK43_09660, partial [Acidimicrobiales bacterium]|nr:hypothetical protein [Acidimicrobiales bacterium]